MVNMEGLYCEATLVYYQKCMHRHPFTWICGQLNCDLCALSAKSAENMNKFADRDKTIQSGKFKSESLNETALFMFSEWNSAKFYDYKNSTNANVSKGTYILKNTFLLKLTNFGQMGEC